MKTSILASALVLTGCFSWPPPPTDRGDVVVRKLADGKIISLDVNLKDLPGVCPGKLTKLYAKGMVEWPGQKPVMRTIGNDVDSFAPASFQVQGPLIKGDDNAHLHPSGDILASVETGFEASITYTPDPQRFTWRKVLRPEYSCLSSYSVSGAEGASGATGDPGQNGDWGQSGTSGGPGDPGRRGADAGRITAYVTVVATAWYPKLYAVIANDTFFLVHPDRELWFLASGGPGGAGGAGGNGGAGGWQSWEEKEFFEDGSTVTKKVGKGPAGHGGNGGNGANGGDGGNGGQIDVTFDSKFPELQRWIQTDIRPGAGGPPGEGGYGGDGGGTEAEVGASQGNPGNPGGRGNSSGRDGRPGRANVRAGNVASRFASIRGIAIHGTPQARSITTKAQLPPISNVGGAAVRDQPPTRPQPPGRPDRPHRGGRR